MVHDTNQVQLNLKNKLKSHFIKIMICLGNNNALENVITILGCINNIKIAYCRKTKNKQKSII